MASALGIFYQASERKLLRLWVYGGLTRWGRSYVSFYRVLGDQMSTWSCKSLAQCLDVNEYTVLCLTYVLIYEGMFTAMCPSDLFTRIWFKPLKSLAQSLPIRSLWVKYWPCWLPLSLIMERTFDYLRNGWSGVPTIMLAVVV